MIEPREIALALGFANAGVLALLSRAPLPLDCRRVIPAALLGFATSYAVGWGTTRLLKRVRVGLGHQPGNAAPLV